MIVSVYSSFTHDVSQELKIILKLSGHFGMHERNGSELIKNEIEKKVFDSLLLIQWLTQYWRQWSPISKTGVLCVCKIQTTGLFPPTSDSNVCHNLCNYDVVSTRAVCDHDGLLLVYTISQNHKLWLISYMVWLWTSLRITTLNVFSFMSAEVKPWWHCKYFFSRVQTYTDLIQAMYVLSLSITMSTLTQLVLLEVSRGQTETYITFIKTQCLRIGSLLYVYKYTDVIASSARTLL